MKYQIIVETSMIMSDDEFLDRATHVWNVPPYMIIEARSLEGIRPEAYNVLAYYDKIRAEESRIVAEREVDISDLL